jgi:hypothetical protein
VTRPTFPEQTGKDSLKYCEDLWWYFHAADTSAGLKSTWEAAVDSANYGAPIASCDNREPNINLNAAGRNRRLFASLRVLSERHYAILRVWYTMRHIEVAETKVAAAHKAFYAINNRKDVP